MPLWEIPTQRVMRLRRALAESEDRSERLRQETVKRAKLPTTSRTREERFGSLSPERDEKSRLLQQFQTAYPGTQIAPEERQRILSSPLESVRRTVQSPTPNLADIGNIDIGSPHFGPEGAPLPVTGNIPGLRTLPEAAATIGTAGLGTLPVTSKVGGLVGALGGGYGGREAGEQIGGDTGALVGEVAGTLGGGLAGGIAGPTIARSASRNFAERGGVRGLASEVGGSRLGPDDLPMSNTPGEPPPRSPIGDVADEVPVDPSQSLTQKVIESAKQARATRHLVKEEQHLARAERTQAFRDELTKLTDEGVPIEEALPKARSLFAGKQSSIVGEGFEITPAEREWFQGRLMSIPPGREYTMSNVFDSVFDASSGKLPTPGQQKIMAEVFGDDFTKAIWQLGKNSRKPGFDPLSFLSDVAMVPIHVKSALDASSLLRQNWKIGLRHPKEWLVAARQATKAVPSDAALARVEKAMADDPFEVHIGRNKQAISTHSLNDVATNRDWLDLERVLPTDPRAAERAIIDEKFVSRIAEKAPLISHSSRFFVTNGNVIRREAVKPWITLAMKRNAAKYGKEFITPEELKDLGGVMRRGSGLGEIGSETSWLRELTRHLMWAPGLRTSGPQLLWRALDPRGIILPKTVPILGRGTEPIARRAAIEMMGAWLTAGTAAMTVATLAGMEAVTDPLSTNFGTVSVPGSRHKYNVFGQDTNLARMIARTIQGEAVDEFGNRRDLRPDQAFTEYMMSGLNPTIGAYRDIKKGRSLDREYTGWNLESAKAFLQDQFPIFANDLQDSIRMGNPYELPFAVPLAFMGQTQQIYSEVPGKFRAIPKYRTDEAGTKAIIPNAPEALNLGANEEREATDLLEEVQGWINDREQIDGPRPEGVPYDVFISAYGKQKQIDSRDVAAAIFVYRARSKPQSLNPEWVRYALENEDELKQRYPDLYDTQYMDEFRQRALEAGLIQ